MSNSQVTVDCVLMQKTKLNKKISATLNLLQILASAIWDRAAQYEWVATNKQCLLVQNDVTISIAWILPSTVQITKKLSTFCGGGLHSKYSKSPQLNHKASVAGWGVENSAGYTLELARSSWGEHEGESRCCNAISSAPAGFTSFQTWHLKFRCGDEMQQAHTWFMIQVTLPFGSLLWGRGGRLRFETRLPTKDEVGANITSLCRKTACMHVCMTDSANQGSVPAFLCNSTNASV